MKYLMVVSVAVIGSFLVTSFFAEAATITWPHAANQEADKTWKITFNKPVDRTTVTSDTLYSVDSDGVKQKNTITFSNEDRSIQIEPPLEGYRFSQTYTLHITEAIHNVAGKSLKQNVSKTFTIKDVFYEVVNVPAKGPFTLVEKYKSFELAARQMQSDQAVVLHGEIIHMPAGLVSTKALGKSSLTILHSDPSLKREVTYVPSDTELVYVDSTDRYVEIELAGVNYFIRPGNSHLLPSQTIQERSYYYVRDGSLFHSIYAHSAAKYGTYEMGIAPTFMQQGNKYYSTDGSHFLNDKGQTIGTAYQYFQYLPLRSETRYTAEQLDAYIVTLVKELETSNLAVYRDASTKSKLLGLGAELKRVEREHHINAMHILALAQHESQFGMSEYAQKYNNLFGLYATDDNPTKKKFEDVPQNIEELINKFLNKNYLPPKAMYANGTNFGNKAVGINVKYASDPYWGSKIAGHLYRIDRMMGGEELANQAKIVLTDTVNLNIRYTPNTKQAPAYTYAKVGMPLRIVDDQLLEKPWVKVQSDFIPHEDVYVHGDFVDKLN